MSLIILVHSFVDVSTFENGSTDALGFSSVVDLAPEIDGVKALTEVQPVDCAPFVFHFGVVEIHGTEIVPLFDDWVGSIDRTCAHHFDQRVWEDNVRGFLPNIIIHWMHSWRLIFCRSICLWSDRFRIWWLLLFLQENILINWFYLCLFEVTWVDAPKL